jgi:hypothetical protein
MPSRHLWHTFPPPTQLYGRQGQRKAYQFLRAFSHWSILCGPVFSRLWKSGVPKVDTHLWTTHEINERDDAQAGNDLPNPNFPSDTFDRNPPSKDSEEGE